MDRIAKGKRARSVWASIRSRFPRYAPIRRAKECPIPDCVPEAAPKRHDVPDLVNICLECPCMASIHTKEILRANSKTDVNNASRKISNRGPLTDKLNLGLRRLLCYHGVP